MHLRGCNQPWRSFHAANPVTSLIRWRVVNRGQCTRPTFLAGHYNARFTGIVLVCVCSCTQAAPRCMYARYTAKYRVFVKSPVSVPCQRKPLANRVVTSWIFFRFVRPVSFHVRVFSVTEQPISVLNERASGRTSERASERAIATALKIHTRWRWALLEILATCYAYASIKNSCTSLTLLPYIPV